MDTMLSVRKQTLALRATLIITCALGLASPAAAGPRKIVKGSASGNIISQVLCSENELCQESTVTGQATNIGPFVGRLSERVDLTTGAYTGTGLFTTPNGDTFSTEHTGNVTPPDRDGRVFFVENHEIVGGTGRFADTTGDLHVVGTADAVGEVHILAVGTISK